MSQSIYITSEFQIEKKETKTLRSDEKKNLGGLEREDEGREVRGANLLPLRALFSSSVSSSSMDPPPIAIPVGKYSPSPKL